jgi:SNF2 family DNA or RNA helicase
VDFICEHDYNVLVANAQGTGKTVVALSCVARGRKKLTPTIIVCPASVVTNWCREAKKWVPGATIHAVSDLGSRMPKRRVDIFVVSWAILADRYLDLCSVKPQFLVIDECHYAKAGSDTLRGQAFGILAKRTPHMVMLSGTPLVNRPSELATIKAFFNVAGEVPTIRRLLEDVLPEIPPKTRSTVPIRLRPKDEKEYRKAETEFADWLEEELKQRLSRGEAKAAAERALAAEALTKTGYLRRMLGIAKVPAAVDWISKAVRLGEPVVVFAEHQEVVTRLQKFLTKQRIRHVTIDGGAGRKQRQYAIDAFQAGVVPVLIGTKAAKEGITLTRARNLLFVERYFTSADEEQAEDRIRRYGQKHPTTIWFLHAHGTLDDRLQEIIETKRKLVAEHLGSAEIEESDEAAVLSIITAWHNLAAKHVQPEVEPTDLGLGKPMPPLPDPASCYQLVFKRPRWSKAAALAWMGMHGFRARDAQEGMSALRATTLPLPMFIPGRFQTVQVSAEIHAVIGVRKPVPKGAKPARGVKRAKAGARKKAVRSTPSAPRTPPLLRR